MATEFRVSYWYNTDKREDGSFDPAESTTVSVVLNSQTLLFENETINGKIRDFEDLYGSIIFVLELQLVSQMINPAGIIIHKIWTP